MISKNYTLYHLHSDYSNTSTMDSASKVIDYIEKAKELGMTSICFSEHGNIYNWVEKKQLANKNGLKYIHGVEVYVTEDKIGEDKNRDNYHVVLIAKNEKGVKEINKLTSISYQEDHFYYHPRITIEELYNTSENIIVTSACLGSPLHRWFKNNEKSKVKEFVRWGVKNKDRFFLEIQYHKDEDQIRYNQFLHKVSKQTGLRLIAGTDTHSVNEEKSKARKILQKAKKMYYDNEDNFDLVMKSYDELCKTFALQGSLPEEVYLEAIENTNVMSDMVEDFELDYTFKYPSGYDNAQGLLKKECSLRLKDKVVNGVIAMSDKSIYIDRLKEEFKAMKKLGMCSYILFMKDLFDYCKSNNIVYGYGRGSATGSLIAYLFDITDVNPIEWDTMFSRFINEDRVSLADIDIDFATDDRVKIYDWIREKSGVNRSAKIIAFNTIREKKAMDEIGRALELPLNEVSQIKKEYEDNPEKTMSRYPKVFKYFNDVVGVIESASVHPAGIVSSPITLNDNIGFSLSKDKEIITTCDMKCVDGLNYVKYDILGLKNVNIIRDACNDIGIPFMKTHEIDFNDMKVWRDIWNDNTAIFQMEAGYIKDILKNYKPVNLAELSFINGLIRPASASFRDQALKRIRKELPIKEIGDIAKDTENQIVYQEQIIQFLNRYCGYTMPQADIVRKGLSKKIGTEQYVEDIKKGFLETMPKLYNYPLEILENAIEEFSQIIIDAAGYGFSYNHSIAYSMIGYACGYLRYYYPLEFITAILNNAKDEQDFIDGEKLAKKREIDILPVKFGYSSGSYNIHRETNSIYKGLKSVKYVSDSNAEELLKLSKKSHKTFVGLLINILEDTKVNSRATEILIRLNFFEEYGTIDKLMYIYNEFNNGSNKYKKTYVDKTKDKRVEFLESFEINCKESEYQFDLNDVMKQIKFEFDNTGSITYKDTSFNKKDCIVLDINTNYTPRLVIYRINDGRKFNVKISKPDYKSNSELKKGYLIRVEKSNKKKGWIKTGDKWEQTNVDEVFLTQYKNLGGGN